ncbi:MAG: hypothetical protein M1819_005286 [Sarea resinae]|nr:MAG: hypothetical protein M1819_005286 [Sarea resinae]
MTDRATLTDPPPIDTSKAPIENILDLTPLSDIGPDIFTNTRLLWHPPGARGIYGGAVIAQCLSAAHRTVPKPYSVHSMHCYFVLAGDSEIPVIYHVEHVREGKSFITRTVQARQRGKCIFTVTMSFVRDGSGGKEVVEHAVGMPDFPGPIEGKEQSRSPEDLGAPIQSQPYQVSSEIDQPNAPDKKIYRWIKARGTISPDGGHEAHLSALAYMSDSYFIGTVQRVHGIGRLPVPAKPNTSGLGSKSASSTENKAAHQSHVADEGRPQLGMMVSLDHTIYFHNPKAFRADDWLFTEMETPWAGDGRGLVMQRIFTREGKLIATCVQEVWTFGFLR